MAESRKPVISVHDLAKNYGELKVLRKIDMDIYKGFVSIPLNKVNSAKSDSDFAAQQTVPKIIWHQRYNKHRFTPPNGTSHFCKAEIEPLPYRCGGKVLQLVNSVRPYTICADIASL